MFDISPEKFLVLATVAVVVLGPERIPRAARQLARVRAQIRRLTADVDPAALTAITNPRQALLGTIAEPRAAISEAVAQPRLALADAIADFKFAGGPSHEAVPAAPTEAADPA